MAISRLRVAARASALARKQVEEVMLQLPHVNYELHSVQTIGDNNKQVSLWDEVPEDFFTRELDGLLLAKSADVAIHSAKDLPHPLPKGLCLLALTAAADTQDALVSHDDIKLAHLPSGSRVGTSSPARRDQILQIRPDVDVVSIRGTIEERLCALDNGSVDAVIVAACALQRLGMTARITQYLPIRPHPLQGHLAVVGAANRADLRVLFAALDIRRQWGKIWLLGAGIGEADYLTLKAHAILQRAEVIVHDALLPCELLERYSCEKIAVGKRAGCASISQAEINQLLVDCAKKYNVVARLKGGDPFVFARGGEELGYIQRQLVAVEAVPGISSFQAAAVAANIALSQRGVNNRIELATTRAITDHSGTLSVYYMGGQQLDEVREAALSTHDAHTPAAVLSCVGTVQERIDVVALAQLNTIQPILPALVMVGENIKTRVESEKVLFTGTDRYSCRLNYRLIDYPLITIKNVDFVCPNMADYDAIVFTSKNAVRSFCSKQRLLNQFIISIGSATTRCLAEHGIIANYQPERADSDELYGWLRAQPFSRVLYPTSQRSRNALHELEMIEALITYHTEYAAQPKLELDGYIGVVFTSGSTVESFFALYQHFPQHLIAYVCGAQTERCARKYGVENILRVD